ncbi:MAG TPA: PilN domain-containing protein [Candidatus Manganitrophaceae bacterium]|nr:PilN domain-containing protein [Candidatus Manganitrophaceae bacterium]
MIKINLLPSQKTKKTKRKIEIQSQLILASVILSIAILILGYIWILLNEKVDGLNAEKTKLTSDLTALKAKVKEVENYERDKKVVEEKIKIIERLRKNQSIPVHLLDEVSRSMPDRVWLMNMNEQGGTIDLEGKATTNSEIVDFINNLKKSPFFKDVQILESRQSLEEQIAVYTFKLKLAIIS